MKPVDKKCQYKRGKLSNEDLDQLKNLNKSIVKQTAILVAGCNLPARMVESKAFKSLITSVQKFGKMKPNAELPSQMFSRRAMTREINDISTELTIILSQWLNKALNDMAMMEPASAYNDKKIISTTFVLDHKGFAGKSQHAGITIVIRTLEKNAAKKFEITTNPFPVYLEDIQNTGGKDFAGNANVLKYANEHFLGEFGRFGSLCCDAAVVNNQSSLLRDELNTSQNCRPMSISAISCNFHGNMNVQKKTNEIIIVETGTTDYYQRFDISSKRPSQQREYFQ